ncbi:GNAT family N-acetyltransferase [Euzebya tangerina]|uniref:GNAT family N-acetyltransferase n=1 Tax=Euzebya tangerina TaxID=591198 RepID=UPI000E31294E|nr:GNAT family N-acetyltransferase [Euzebya tangerina]
MTSDTITRAGRTLARAFYNDPLFRHVMPDDDRRARALPHLFAGTARRCRALGGLETVADAAGVAGWLPGDRLSMTGADVMRFGMLTLPLRLTLTGMRRLVSHDVAADEMIEAHLRPGDAYLWVLAVDPARHGEGLGRRAMTACRDAARASGATRLTLKTENRDNVPLYQHLGFELLEQDIVPSSQLTVSVFAQDL